MYICTSYITLYYMSDSLIPVGALFRRSAHFSKKLEMRLLATMARGRVVCVSDDQTTHPTRKSFSIQRIPLTCKEIVQCKGKSFNIQGNTSTYKGIFQRITRSFTT